MKMRLVVALVGLAISLALPTFAQQKDTVDPKSPADSCLSYEVWWGIQQERRGRARRVLHRGRDAGDAARNISRQAIEKDYAKHSFRQWQATNQVTKVDRVIAVGNEVRSIGKWSCNFRTQAGNADRIQGSYSSVLVREGDNWKIRKYTYSEFGTGKPGGGI